MADLIQGHTCTTSDPGSLEQSKGLCFPNWDLDRLPEAKAVAYKFCCARKREKVWNLLYL